MFASRLFWKLFLTYAGLFLLAAAGFVMLVSQRQRILLEDQHQRRLHNVAVVLRESLSEHFPEEANPALQNRLRELAEETGTRITLIRGDGLVVGDSDFDPAEMENHADRPEVLLAESGQVGLSRRESPTLEIPMMYVAVPVFENGTPAGFARVAADLAMIEAELARLTRRTFLAAGGASLIILLLTYLIVARIVRPVLTLTTAARALARGEAIEPLHLTREDEIGQLARAFNSMSWQLTDRIDELQEKSRELEENNRRLGTVLSGMIEGVIAVDRSERILFANRAARPLLDLPPEEVIGRPVFEVIRNKTVQEVIRETLSGRTRQAVEFEVPRSQSVLAMLAARMPGDPCPGVVLVTHEVTELRRLENLRHEFVSNVSHELKTPLTAIQTSAETLLNGALDDPETARRFLEQIDEQSERLHMLILDLLHLAKIESGREVFEVEPLAIGPVIQNCIEEHRAIAEAKPVKLVADSPAEELKIEAESEGLRSILNNLIDNAIKYTPADGRVKVSWRAEADHAVITVEDTGVGIASEHQDRIFERFYRVDKARSRELGGTGLGLSIVKHLTQMFQGRVSVTSRPGQGSTFTVRLPLA